MSSLSGSHEQSPEWREKISRVRKALEAQNAPISDLDDTSISHALTENDGNTEAAVNMLKEFLGLEDEPRGGLNAAVGSTNQGAEEAGYDVNDRTPTASPTNTLSPPSHPPPSALMSGGRIAAVSPPTSVNTNAPADPQVAELKMMFPNLDSTVIQAVIESHSNIADPDEKLNLCIGDLLQITDPEYKPETQSAASRQAEVNRHLDEEFARSLYLRDQQRMAEEDRRQQGAQGGLPYQPRQGRRNQAGILNSQQYEAQTVSHDGYDSQNQGQQGERFEEKFQQIAEVGRQKFDSFWSKARSKYGEFQQAQQQRQQVQVQSGATAQGPSGIGATLGGILSDATAVATGKKPDPTQTSPFDGPPATGAGGGRGAYSRQSNFTDSVSTAPPPASKRWQPSDTFDESPRAVNMYSTGSRASSSSSLPSTSDEGSGSAPVARSEPRGIGKAPGAGSSVAAGSLSQPKRDEPIVSPGSGAGKIDLAKIGMLPKRRVSLLSSSPSKNAANSAPIHTQVPPPSSSTVRKDGDQADEEEEYTR